jgi:hypothetical protein
MPTFLGDLRKEVLNEKRYFPADKGMNWCPAAFHEFGKGKSKCAAEYLACQCSISEGKESQISSLHFARYGIQPDYARSAKSNSERAVTPYLSPGSTLAFSDPSAILVSSRSDHCIPP